MKKFHLCLANLIFVKENCIPEKAARLGYPEDHLPG
jgi:hypothetical protein